MFSLLSISGYILFQLFFCNVQSHQLQSVETTTTSTFINTTYYSTNPRISYNPESQCAGGILGACGTRYDPWEHVSYTSPEGTVETFFRTSNWQNQPNTDQIRRVSFGFTGTAVYLYGAPRAHLQYKPGLHEVCLEFSCTPLRVDQIYEAFSGPETQPVLLWYREGLIQSRHHEVQIRFLESSSGSRLGMTFDHSVVTDIAPEERTKWKLRADEEFLHVTYEDTNPRISYSPQSPWDLRIFSDPYGRKHSFHQTSSWGHQPNGGIIRTIRWTFKGAALFVYGAPKNRLQYNPGHAEISLDGTVYPIDAARIYNNVQSYDEPVLLFSYELLNPNSLSTAILRFLQKEAPITDGQRGMAFSKAVFTQVRKARPAIPGTTYTKHRVLDSDSDVKYLPVDVCISWFLWWCTNSFNPWDREFYFNRFRINRSYYRTSTWKNELSGNNNRRITYYLPPSVSSVELYGAPPSHLIHPHGKQEACLNDECYPIDTVQAYLNVGPVAQHDPVLIWSMDGLDPSRHNAVTMRLMDQTEDEDRRVRGMTFAELVYWERREPGVPPQIPGETTSTFITSVQKTTTAAIPSIPKTTTTAISTTSKHAIPSATRSPLPFPKPPNVEWPILLSALFLFMFFLFAIMLLICCGEKRRDPERQPLLPPYIPPPRSSSVPYAPPPPRLPPHIPSPQCLPPPPYSPLPPPPTPSRLPSERNHTGSSLDVVPILPNHPSNLIRSSHPPGPEPGHSRTESPKHNKQPSNKAAVVSEEPSRVSTTHNDELLAGPSRHPIPPDQEISRAVSSPSGPSGSTSIRGSLTLDQVARLSNLDIKRLSFEVLVLTLNGVNGNSLYSMSNQRPWLEYQLRQLRNIEKHRIEEDALPQGNRDVPTTGNEAVQRENADKKPTAAGVEGAQRRSHTNRRWTGKSRAEPRTRKQRGEIQRGDPEDQPRQERRPAEEQRRGHGESRAQDAFKCVDCQNTRATFSLLECGHMCVCADCSKKVNEFAPRYCQTCGTNVKFLEPQLWAIEMKLKRSK